MRIPIFYIKLRQPRLHLTSLRYNLYVVAKTPVNLNNNVLIYNSTICRKTTKKGIMDPKSLEVDFGDPTFYKKPIKELEVSDHF